MIEIGDVKKDGARKGDVRTSTTQTTMNSAGKLNDSKNYNTHTIYLARHFHGQKGGFVCSTKVLWKITWLNIT